MKKIILLAAVLSISIIATACTNMTGTLGGEKIVGSKTLVTTEYKLEGFSMIDSSHSFEITIEKADSYKVEIESDDNIVDYHDVRVDGDRLILSLKPNMNYNNVTLKAKISTPDLKAISASGSSDIKLVNKFDLDHDFVIDLSGASYFIGDIKVDKLDINLSGSSDLDGKLESSSMTIDMSGASSISSSGKTNVITADIGGSSDIKMYELSSKTVQLDMSGSSDAQLNVSKSIDVSASGSSTLRYIGDVKNINQDLSGSSEVINKN